MKTLLQTDTTLRQAHLILRRADQVLLGRRRGTGRQDGKFQFPAGRVEDETALAAVIREAHEETGIRLNSADVRFVHLMDHYEPGIRTTLVFFEASLWTDRIENREPDKCEGWHWFPVTSPPAGTIPCLAVALTHLRHGVTYSEYDEGRR